MEHIRFKLSDLTYEMLDVIPCWRSVLSESNDLEITPAMIDSLGYILAKNEEVWCLFEAYFSNGDLVKGCCNTWSDDIEKKLLQFSFWNGNQDIALILPPAPKFVLDKEGPEVFSSKFNSTIDKVFPIQIKTIPKFELERSIREVTLVI